MSASKKPNPWSNALPYPKPVAQRTGCKVRWHYYDNEEDAKTCAVAAKHNARIAEEQGFDFGYCCPGSVDKAARTEYAGLWEVCLP